MALAPGASPTSTQATTPVPADGAGVDSDSGQSQWFEEAVRELLPQLYAAAKRLTGSEPDAEDLVADAVLSAWQARDSLRDRAAFTGWMRRILTNSFLEKRRAASVRPAEESLEELEARDSFSLFERLHQPFLLWWGNPEQQFLERLLRSDFERALDALPDTMRVVVVLADVEGMSYAAIAELLAIPIGTVRSRLARGRSLLQRSLWAHAVDAGIAAAAEEEHVRPSQDGPNDA
jgi:RNA polymerase sigma-70 factor (ECF subfamily)